MSELVDNIEFALMETIRFWRELERTGLSKGELVQSTNKFKNFHDYHEYCALCEYTKESVVNLIADCSECPVDWAVLSFKTEKEDGIIRGHCQHISSPFRQWEIAKTVEGKERWAGEVADLAQRTLDKLKEVD